jgi:predicted DNA-binding transcriptional regulator AlpA
MNTTEQLSPDMQAIGRMIADAVRQAAIIPPERALLDKADIGFYLKASASTVERTIAKPTFPAPCKIEGGPLRWVAHEVYDWLEQQRGARVKRARGV